MKRIFTLLLSMALCVFVSSTGVASSDEPITIGVAAYAMDEYQKTWADSFENYAKTLGNVKIIMTNADGSIDKQLSDIDSLIAQAPNVILMRPVDADGLVAGVEACANAGIPVVISSYTVNSDKYDAWIGANQKDNGVLQAQYLADYLEKNPEVELQIGYVWGTMGLSGCQERFDGLNEWVETCDRATIVSEKVANWSVNEAMAVMEDWLQGMPEINTIVCQNDEMATGIANVLRAAGKDMNDYLVLGIDGSANGLQYIRDGLIDATISTDIDAETKQNLDLALQVAAGEKFTEPVSLDSYVLVTAESIDE